MAYRKKSKVNWCPECATVLANEQVIDGRCWRHEDTIVEQRDLVQWFLRITAYAQELLDGLDKLEGWPEKVRTMQRNWIGRSEGTEVDFFLQEDINEGITKKEQGEGKTRIRVFTTRVDTIFGATSVQLAPEHPLVTSLASDDAGLREQVAKLLEEQKKAREAGDIGEIEKHGIPTGRFAINPYSGELVPIWVANYVLSDYGTGAIMSVPGHDERDFEFAKKYAIPVRRVIAPADKGVEEPELPWSSEDGVLVNSGEFNGLSCHDAQKKLQEIAARKGFGEATVTFRLKDWGVSRQRYWGTPIPMIHCERDGIVPVPDEQLPVLLPEKIEITQQGGSPLIACAGLRERDLPEVQGAGQARDGHDGYVRRLELVFLSLHRREECERSIWFGDRAVLVSDRSIHRRRGACHSASDLFALLDEGDARPGHDHQR